MMSQYLLLFLNRVCQIGEEPDMLGFVIVMQSANKDHEPMLWQNFNLDRECAN